MSSGHLYNVRTDDSPTDSVFTRRRSSRGSRGCSSACCGRLGNNIPAYNARIARTAAYGITTQAAASVVVSHQGILRVRHYGPRSVNRYHSVDTAPGGQVAVNQLQAAVDAPVLGPCEMHPLHLKHPMRSVMLNAKLRPLHPLNNLDELESHLQWGAEHARTRKRRASLTEEYEKGMKGRAMYDTPKPQEHHIDGAWGSIPIDR